MFDETQCKIIHATMELIMERGYTAATTRDIADRAGINSDNITCIILDVKQTGEANRDERRIRRLKALRGAIIALSAGLVGLLGYNAYLLFDLLR